MNDSTTNTSNYIGYEHMTISVKPQMMSVYEEAYPHFGWTPDGNDFSVAAPLSVGIRYKRDRKIRNKVELNRLQRQFESSAKEIERLENSKTLTASIVAYIIGVVGTAFMALSVFCFLPEFFNIMWLSIVLAVPGIIGWIIPYFCFVNIKAKKIKQVMPIIDKQYDDINEICEKAHSLLSE